MKPKIKGYCCRRCDGLPTKKGKRNAKRSEKARKKKELRSELES